MTPRPGKDTDPTSHPGLSTFEELDQAAPPGGKAQKIDLTKLKEPLVGVPDGPPEGHVSIRPGEEVRPEMLKALNEWAQTRQEGTHPFTQCLLEACVEEVRRPK
jgi:hypothetical protein